MADLLRAWAYMEPLPGLPLTVDVGTSLLFHQIDPFHATPRNGHSNRSPSHGVGLRSVRHFLLDLVHDVAGFFRERPAFLVLLQRDMSDSAGDSGEQGCDGSVLLDDDGNFVGEKNAGPNANSLRGFEVVDTIKAAVEIECPQTVSCADILALAARESVALLGGPSWALGLGRRDSTTASLSGANSDLPSPASSIPQLVSAFAAKGLSARDMTALSGAHTVGQARCVNFRDHVNGDANIDASFAEQRRRSCPASGGDGNLAPLDEQTAGTFDNAYFQNLLEFRGLLHSDQVLYSNGTQESSLVQLYASDPSAFEADFAAAMVKMSNLSPLTGNSGEIRMNCRSVN
ncbi:hypothetical protein ZIOFF_008417 [Zingiber officinale]|uniref:Peroxidase n=1 Tax=Zingiber officinale TaxID=94328 RepID=A0A8J5II73_ZINOF|nr:hypothetical protein ZIOFF_008417 [Zingiber officinale]